MMIFFLLLSCIMMFITSSYGANQVSSSCSQAIQSFLVSSNVTSSCLQLTAVMNSSFYYDDCTISNQGVDCQNLGQVINTAEDVSDEHPIAPPYNIPSSDSACALCDEDIISPSCANALTLIMEVILGSSTSYDADDLDLTEAVFLSHVGDIKASCSNSQDQMTITYLAYQSNLVCSQSNSYSQPITSYYNLVGALDMRSTMQCGYCAVMQCLSGQYCAQNEPAVACPAGSYCPNPSIKLACPSGHYCPESSIEPVRCRPVAAGSCAGEGHTREVVWVPLFIALMICLSIYLSYRKEFSPDWWIRLRGLPRPDIISSSTSTSSSISKLATGASIHPSKLGLYTNTGASTYKLKTKMISTMMIDHIDDPKRGSLRVSIMFDELKFFSGATVRLADVSGCIKAGKFTAILGGSGAGKTSLMNAILAREKITSGRIRFQAQGIIGDLPQHTLNRIIGFVPQTDVLIRSMTVYQVIKHSAQTRLPFSFTSTMVDEQVEFVIEQLGLENIRDVIIGGDEDFQGQGISAGDRKKTNIAVELVSSPSVLFLDEPTSGIDASSALSVASIIRGLAHANLTCVAVIHQPRGEIFDLIDDLILLVPGGKVAYQGPIKYVIGWFALYGYHLPHSKANRTDFLLDVTCGKIQKSSTTSEENDESWDVLWNRDGASYLSQCNSNHIHDEQVSGKMVTTEQSQATLARVISRPSIPYQVYVHMKRTILQRIKGNSLQFYLLVHLVAGIIMGIITCGGPLVILNIPSVYQISCPPGAETLCRQWQRFQIGPACFLINMILGCITIPTAVNTFGREKEISYREAAVGVKPVVYWLGKLLGDIPFCAIGAFVYIAPMLAIAPWRADTGSIYIAMLLLSIFITGLGYNLSFLFSNADNATLAGAILAILFNLFGGFVPNLGNDPQGSIFYTHYISRLVVTAELHGSNICGRDFNSVVPEPWQNSSFGLDVGNMFIIIGVVYLCSYVGVRYNLRKVKF